jgi:hypothetical protein
MGGRFANADAAIPQPKVVAGVLLHPFCLGHHLLLKHLGLPFAGNPEADCGPDDVVVGIAICGLTYGEGIMAVHHGELPDIIARWRKRAGGPWWKPVAINMDESEEKFREYLRDGYQMPPVWRHEGAGIDMTAPWEYLLKCRLVSAGFSEDEVLSGYLPSRWYDYFTVSELIAAEKCDDPKKWRRLFFNKEHAEALNV